MKINIQAIKFEMDDQSRDYAAEKFGHLEKYYKNIVRADIYLEEQAGDTANVRYGVKAKLEIPGKNVFAEDFDKDIFTAIDKVENKVKEQLIRSRDKKRPNPIHAAKGWVRGFFGEKGK